MMSSNSNQGILPVHGGYRKLYSYQKAEIIFDGTIYFTNRFFRRFDRTVDQMVQAARSGKQNIAEGSMASATSKKTEIKLTNVAKASLEELLIDYQDFLRVQKLNLWESTHPLVKRQQEINKSTPNPTYETFRKAIEHDNPEICANTMITLINFATYLLKRQIAKLEKDFINDGGITERMSVARKNHRNNHY
jgi:four helix bundle suffix protein